MEELLKKVIKDVPDFPKKGIIFKDFIPILENSEVFSKLIDSLVERYKDKDLTEIVSVESRGFLIGAPLAYMLKKPLVLVRKLGKLPRATFKQEYDLEYGTDCLEIHQDSIAKGDRVLIVDDLLATGGTVTAAAKLVEQCGAKVEEIFFIMELDFLKGRDKLKDYNIHSIVHY